MAESDSNVINQQDKNATMSYIVCNAQNVSISMKGIQQLTLEVMTYMLHNITIDNIGEIGFKYVRLSSEFHPTQNDCRAVDWLFVLNTLNFALWPKKNEPEWSVNGLTGYMALCAAIKRAIDEKKPMWYPRFYSNLSMADMKHIFRGDNDSVIPSITKRLAVLHSVGQHLLIHFKGTFVECIKVFKNNVTQIARALAKFPSYDDTAQYDNRPVGLATKATLLLVELNSFFGVGHQYHIKLPLTFTTMLADYRVVQVFKHFGALDYNKNFLDKLANDDEYVKKNSEEDLEIRCCSLMIVKDVYMMFKEKCRKYMEVTPISELNLPTFSYMTVIDNFLWDYRQMHDEHLKRNVLLHKIDTDQY